MSASSLPPDHRPGRLKLRVVSAPPPASSVGLGRVNGGRRHRPRRAIALALAFTVFAALNAAVAALEPSLLRTTSYDGLFLADRVGWYLDTSPPPDIAFMGSSRTYWGLRPSVAEREIQRADGVTVRAMNLGMAEADIELDYLILKNFMTDQRKPRTIVYGLSEYELNSALSVSSPFLPYFGQMLSLDDYGAYGGNSINQKLSFLLERLVPLYRDRDLVRRALSIAVDPGDPTHQYYGTGYIKGGLRPYDAGFLPPHSNWGPRYWESAAEFASNLRPFQLSGFRLARLNDFLDLARDRGINVVLVNLPVSPLYRTHWESPAQERSYVAAVRSTARDHGTPLLDLYDDSGRYIPPDGYVDGYHLNQTGGEILTTMVARGYLVDQFARH